MDTTQATYRILDASLNRASEGFRTLEEFSRFVLENRDLSVEVKSLRHELANSFPSFLNRRDLLSARNTQGDVGTSIETASEYVRIEPSQVIAAAASRVQQSLRVIEEYGKLIEPDFPRVVEQIRYRCYDVCAKLELLANPSTRQKMIHDAKLYLLIDGAESEEVLMERIERFSEAGVDVFQLRDHSLDDRTLYHRSKAAVAATRRCNRLFIVNDRADIAAASDADGVHVGQEELPVDAARKILGHDRLVGVSTHSREQAEQAVRDGADYIGCGPVFSSRTKQFDYHLGTDLLRDVASAVQLPAFAIGGIEQSNLKLVLHSGFTRIAVTGAIRDAVDPYQAALELRKSL